MGFGVVTMDKKKIEDFIDFNEEFKVGVLNNFDVENFLLDFGSLLSEYINEKELM